MVVLNTIQNIIDSLPQTESFSLPSFKQNPLKVEFIRDVSLLSLYLTVYL